jgi:antitoxin component of RelBE/YafQ-DinJ toxin-antitoxin module
MGLSLSAIINIYLRTFVRTKRIEIDLSEIPDSIERKWEKDRKAGAKKYDNSFKLIAESLK